MERYTAFFHEVDLSLSRQVGGKGANLGELTRRGFPVPPGFCVMASAFDDFLKCADLEREVVRLSSLLDPMDFAGLERHTADLRERIESSSMPPELEDAIRRARERLVATVGREPVLAVRSSVGTRDGGRSSFPGQMDTYVNVRGVDQVVALVRKCWASAWTSRAASTRLRLGLGPFDIIIAPLVQVMIPSEVAGVMFTANPLSGDPDELVINASFGLGETVVSGTMEPDEFLLDKRTGGEKRVRIARKGCKLVLDPARASQVRRVSLDDRESLQPSLNREQLAELLETALRIESSYGGTPQDIEWAFSQGRLHILQSRTVSFPPAARASAAGREEVLPETWECEFDTRVSGPPCVYTSANISEVLPGVLTPLTCEGLKALDYGFWKPNYDSGLWRVPFPEDRRELLYLGIFYGRPHLNLTRFRQVVGQVPGGSTAEFDRPLPREETDRDEVPRFRLSPRALFVFLRFLIHGARTLRRVPHELEGLAAQVRTRYATLQETDLRQQPLAEMLSQIEGGRDQGLEVMRLHIENSTLAVTFFESLRQLTGRWLGDASGSLASRLVTGLATLESARPNQEIYRLHLAVRESPWLRDFFLSRHDAEIDAALRRQEHPEARAFLSRLRHFLRLYGSRSVNEAELMLPSWDQDPAFVFSMIRNLLQAEDPEDPLDVAERRRRERELAVAEARRDLSGPRLRLFLWILKKAQTYIAYREQNKALLMLGVHALKRVYFEISCRLQAQGTLRDREDLYFLTEEEVFSLCRGEDLEIEDRVRRRRRQWEWNQRVTLPETFRGRPEPVRPGTAAAAAPAGPAAGENLVLRGLGVSPGRVTGKARVVLDPRKDAHFRKGEILVAPVTDTGWTPFFMVASAIVVDVGGLLSHGSIVAREYGIPGVLNVRQGTRRIRTGQTVTVDGTLGEVIIHPETGTPGEGNIP